MARNIEVLLTMLGEVAAHHHCRRVMINRAIRHAELESEGAPCEGWRGLKAYTREAARLRSVTLAADSMMVAANRLAAARSCPHAVREFAYLAEALLHVHEPERRQSTKHGRPRGSRAKP